MNSLSLRVSAIKTTENTKKNSEIRLSAIALPTTNLFTKKFEPNIYSNEDLVFLDEFKNQYSNAGGIEPQLLALKKLTTKVTEIKPNCPQADNGLYVQAIADIYFHATLKHPVRNTLAKTLHTTHQRKNQIIQALLKSIEESNLHNSQLLKNQPTIYVLNEFVNSLTGCFENFPEAIAAMEKCFLDLLLTIDEIIADYLDILKDTSALSPAKRSEIYIFLHNAIRVALSVVQQFQTKITEKKTIAHILEQTWDYLILRDEYVDVPMDTKVNCGILKAFHDRIFCDVYTDPEQLFCSQRDLSNMPSYEPQAIREICYYVAILNTIVESDFENDRFFLSVKIIVQKLSCIAKTYTMDSAILMALSRAMVQLSKKLLILFKKFANQLHTDRKPIVIEMVEHCLNCVWINVDHPGDSVRHQAKELLKNLLKLAHQFPQHFNFILTEVLAIAKASETSETLVGLLLDYLCQVFGSRLVLDEIPDLQRRILGNIFKEPSWSACYERLMVTNCSDVPLENWCETWIRPLLRIDEFEWHSRFDRLKIIRNLFEKSLRARPEAAEFILTHSDLSLEIYLFVLWTMRKSGRKSYSPAAWKPSNDNKVVMAKVHPNDEIRILAFRILIECHKTTELFPASDLDEILDFFRLNCNCQNPSIRQQINTCLKKALSRLEGGHMIIIKTDSDVNREISANYKLFIAQLIEFCGEWCLFEGANFSRRTTGLTTLLHATQTWCQLWPTNHLIFTNRLIQRLLKTLSDSYASNKMLANQILRHCPRERLTEVVVVYSKKQLRQLVTSVRPDESVTVAHYLEYCIFSGTHFQRAYDAVVWCEKLLNKGLATAKKSLLKAARVNPLYGLILCIRHLLSLVDFMKTTDPVEIDEWRTFFKRFIPKCQELTEVVAPIVNSSAPEGHLPNDFSNIENFGYFNASEDSDDSDNYDDERERGEQFERAYANGDVKITPQVMLICAWRTVREVSLLLGDITLRTPVISTLSHSKNGLITVDDLLNIGLHFQHLLAETKHRGAFEQAYVGFSKLCIRLWRANEPELHCRPIHWLKELMAIIGDDPDDDLVATSKLSVSKLCATRRSAGVPFMVQALITSEFQVCSSSGLTYCMKQLIEICRSCKRAESRTHALNILRALFRCAELGDAVSEYISDGIECSIRAYSAITWPERNSATLLFAALMTRIFGVQHTRETDHLNIRNKMTGRIFFIRYPSLYDFFLAELQYCSGEIERNERPIRLHPLLLLISRLYPSALEGSESNLKLTTFIPLISACSSSPELVTRNLSAKSLVALITPGKVADRLFEILDLLENSSTLSANTIHGHLLQMLYLLKATKAQTHHISSELLLKFAKQYLQYDFGYDSHSILLKVYIDIVIELFITCHLDPSDCELQKLLVALQNTLDQNPANAKGFNRLTLPYVKNSYNLLKLLFSETLTNGPAPTVNTSTFENIETQLNILLLTLHQKYGIEFENQDFSPIEIDVVSFISKNSEFDDKLFDERLPNMSQLQFIAENRRQFYPIGTIKSYTALSILLSQSNVLNESNALGKFTNFDALLALMKTVSSDAEIDDVSNATWKFINSILASGAINLDNTANDSWLDVLSFINHNSLTYKAADLRYTAADTLSIIHKQMLKRPLNSKLLITFSELVLILLRDDSVSVRNKISDFVFLLTQKPEDGPVQKAIPIVAENTYLEWLDEAFSEIDGQKPWVLWRSLLQQFDLAKENGSNSENGANYESGKALDDIFDANEANLFGETLFACFKCYKYLLNRIEAADSLNEAEKNDLKLNLDKQFPMLADF